jgi:hypothetical protein
MEVVVVVPRVDEPQRWSCCIANGVLEVEHLVVGVLGGVHLDTLVVQLRVGHHLGEAAPLCQRCLAWDPLGYTSRHDYTSPHHVGEVVVGGDRVNPDAGGDFRFFHARDDVEVPVVANPGGEYFPEVLRGLDGFLRAAEGCE